MNRNKAKRGNYSKYRPRYFPKIITPETGAEYLERWLLKVESSVKDAYHKATDSFSVRYAVLDNCHGVRIELVPLKTILEARREVLMGPHSKQLILKNELKCYLPLNQWTLISGSADWINKVKGVKNGS